MNNTPSLNEINKTANMDPNLLTRHYKLKLMNGFMHVKYSNPKLKQSEIASHLDMSPSTIQRYRNDLDMLSPYRITPNNVKKRSKKAKIDDNGDLKDLKWLQKTSRQLQMIIIRKRKPKSILKADLHKRILK